MSVDAPTVRIYKPGPWRRVCTWGMFVGVLAWYGWERYTGDLHMTYATFIHTVLALVLLVIWNNGTGRLEVTPNGIRLRRFGRSMETSWDNVLRAEPGGWYPGFVTYHRTRGIGRYYIALTWVGYALLEGGSHASGENFQPRQVKFKGPGPGRAIFSQTYFPLRLFKWHLKHGDFVEVVEGFAPHAGLRAALAQA